MQIINYNNQKKNEKRARHTNKTARKRKKET